MEPVKVVVRHADGRIAKGYTNDFFPNKPVFHFRSVESQPTDKGVEVYLKDLKAVFFVKDFTGKQAYNEKKDFTEGQQLSGRKVEVTFKDGEVLVGSTLGYDPNRLGFFVIPADTQSNNLRAFVVSTAMSKFRFL
jgi:hypothetical protein